VPAILDALAAHTRSSPSMGKMQDAGHSIRRRSHNRREVIKTASLVGTVQAWSRRRMQQDAVQTRFAAV
jgi:hypothetical protein